MLGGDLLIGAVHLMMLVALVGGDCRKIGVCSCQSDEGVIDLSPLAWDGEAMFKDITNPNVYGWKFSYNPCKPYTFGKCSNVAACEYSDDGYGFFSLGTQDTATFSTEASELHLSYSATDQGLLRTTQVTLVCDHSQEKSIEMKPLQSAVFEFTLTSRYCCPQQTSAGLSGGSVVLIAFVAMLLVYIVGGVVFQVGIRKASGKEILPNYTWWSSLPALIKVLPAAAQVKGNCRKTGPCSCESDEGVIDLSPLAGNGDAMFKDVVSSSLYGWKFSWNPCIPFTEGNCRNVAVCELSDDGYAFYNLGTQDSAWFTTVSGVLLLSYNASDEGFARVTDVTLVCDPSQEKSLDALGPLYSATYGFTLTSKYCCPQRETTGLSAGSILLIAFFVLLFMYIVGGVVFQVGVRKSSGKEIIPNYTWWSSLPALIRDGMKFTLSGGKLLSYSKV